MEWGAGATPLSAEFWFDRGTFPSILSILIIGVSSFLVLGVSGERFVLFFFFIEILVSKQY